MKTLNRYFAREIYKATAFAFVAFLALFAFFDLINELDDVGKGGYRLPHVFLFVTLSLPGHAYELFPIAVLIGTMVVLATLAANSEFTVMRVAGLSPGQAAWALARAGATFVVLAVVLGEIAAPIAEKAAQRIRLERIGTAVGSDLRTGIWVKTDTRFVNVGQVLPDSTLKAVRIFEFDREFRLLSISDAAAGRYEGANRWRLSDVTETAFEKDRTTVQKRDSIQWESVLTPDMLSVLLVVPEKLSAWGLYQYTQHLAANKQRTERYEIAFWKKLVFPFAALVMMALALPFAYIQVRHGGVGLKLFAGLMLGVLFHFLNSLFSHIGVLERWPPISAAILPSALFLAMAVAMMWWVERR
ncbi:MAG TPA: LPS export ABC transporter permease LptG [Burkholderiales bacterium]|nr:LPS export ABC transporter permease LptG [Burkholderiales bacterium]